MAPKDGVDKAARTSCTTTRPRRKKKTTLCYEESRRPSDTVTVPVSSDQGSCTEVVKDDGGGCSTPKGERYRIPAMGTCPPAPKKRRPRCWLPRSQRPYFVSPDIEAFFLHALGGISV